MSCSTTLGNHLSSSDYLHKRKLLPPFIGAFPLAGFTIGVTLSGVFFGWQTGLVFGWANMIVSIFLVSIMYMLLVLSLTEMCAALPFTSGLSAFAQAAFNSTMFSFSGGLHAISFIMLPAIVLVSLGNTIETIVIKVSLGQYEILPALYWLPIAGLTILLHCSPRWFFRVTFVLSMYSCLLLCAYLIITHVIEPPGFLYNGNVRASSALQMSTCLSNLSMFGIIRSFPFACTLFMGIESFPSASEEAKKIFHTAPKVALSCLAILTFFAVGLMVTVPDETSRNCLYIGRISFNTSRPRSTSVFTYSSSPPKSPVPTNELHQFIQSKYMLLDNALSLICSKMATTPTWCLYNPDTTEPESLLIPFLIGVTVLPPMLASFFAGIYVSSRHIYFLSRAGVLPNLISRTHFGAPVLATCASLLVAIFAIGIVDTFNGIPYLVDDMTVYSVLSYTPLPNLNLNMAFPRFKNQTSLLIILVNVWVSCLTFAAKFITYIALHVRVPNLPRPFVSPLGVVGAYFGLGLAIGLGVIGPFFCTPYFYGTLLAFMLVLMSIGTVYWLLVAKPRVQNCPEKIFIRHQLKQLWGRSFSVLRTTPQIPQQQTFRRSQRCATIVGSEHTQLGNDTQLPFTTQDCTTSVDAPTADP